MRRRPGRVSHARAQHRDAEERLAHAVASTVPRQEAASLPRSLLEAIHAGVPALVAAVEALETVGTAPAALHVALKDLMRDFRTALAERMAAAVRRKQDG